MTPALRKHINKYRKLWISGFEDIENRVNFEVSGGETVLNVPTSMMERYTQMKAMEEITWDEETFIDCKRDILCELVPGKKVRVSDLVDIILSGKKLGAHPSTSGFANNHAWQASPYCLALGRLVDSGKVTFGQDATGCNYYELNSSACSFL